MSSDSNYEKLSDELQNKINTELFDGNGFKDNAIRRIDKEHDRATLWRPAFVRDVEKIMHSPYYNRYADKTQVFSFLLKNDDISTPCSARSACFKNCAKYRQNAWS